MKFDKKTIFAIVWRSILIACILAGYWLAIKAPSSKSVAIEEIPAIESQPPEVVTKIVYKYSVVEGGVHTEAEIAEARKSDPVVDEHYRYTPKPDRLALITAVVNAHLSYRKGNQIYWTKKPVEFTDWVWAGDVGGELRAVIRARCGNRVSYKPLLPVLAEEPDLDVLEGNGRLAMADLLPAVSLLAGLPLVTLAPVFQAPGSAPITEPVLPEFGPGAALGALGDEFSYIELAYLGQEFSSGLGFLGQIGSLVDGQVPILSQGGVVILPPLSHIAPTASFAPVPEPGTWLVGIALVLGAILAKSRA